MRLVLQKFLLLLFGLAISVVFLELGLRIGGVVVRRMSDRSKPVGDTQGLTILCVGDSHTYGTGVDPSETYPAWLERDLRRIDPHARYRIINMGIPGMNSAQLLHELDGWLERYQPDAVVIWSGLNNLWNRADPGGVGQVSGRDWVLQMLGRLKVVRLFTVLQTQDFLTRLEERGDVGAVAVRARANSWLFSEQRTNDEMRDVTMRDHALMAQVLGQRGVPYVMLTYPRSLAEPVTAHRAAVVKVGRTLGVPVIHTAIALKRAKASFPRAQVICTLYEAERKPCLLVNAMGPHPTGKLYSLISKLVAEELILILRPSAEVRFGRSERGG